jgi:hypothetical protein
VKYDPLPLLAAVLGVFAFVIIGTVLAGPGYDSSPRDKWDEACRAATMRWYKADVGVVGYGSGASQLQRSDNAYILCDNGKKIPK